MKIKTTIFLLVSLLAIIFAAAASAQSPVWTNLEHSRLPVPPLNGPGCPVYRSLLTEVPDPNNPGKMTFRVNPARTLAQLNADCPVSPAGRPQGICPYENLTTFVGEIPPASEARYHGNMITSTGQCKPGYTCGIVNLAGIGKAVMSCVPLAPGNCPYPKKWINGVCQMEGCPGGCGTGKKCSVRLLKGSTAHVTNCPRCEACDDEVVWFCEDKNNEDPQEGIVVPLGSQPKTYPGAQPLPSLPCPAGCNCIPNAEAPTPAGRAGLIKYCRPVRGRAMKTTDCQALSARGEIVHRANCQSRARGYRHCILPCNSSPCVTPREVSAFPPFSFGPDSQVQCNCVPKNPIVIGYEGATPIKVAPPLAPGDLYQCTAGINEGTRRKNRMPAGQPPEGDSAGAMAF